MTEQDKQLLNTFDTKFRQFLYLYEQVKLENSKLLSLISQKDQEIEELKSSCKKLERDYSELKMARTLSIYDKDINDTKKRLSSLVREVDKCIALLNE